MTHPVPGPRPGAPVPRPMPTPADIHKEELPIDEVKQRFNDLLAAPVEGLDEEYRIYAEAHELLRDALG